MEKISIRFHHGLGDASNFAHQIPLYTKRGYEIEVDVTPDKAPVFLASGATIAKGGIEHHYPHAIHEPDTYVNPWNGNKGGFNLSLAPMPNIGKVAELWKEYTETKLNLDSFVTPEIEGKVSAFLDTLPGPIVLTHFQGNTGAHLKNIPHDRQAKILNGLLERTDSTVINLDWDNRVIKLDNYRIRHLTDDWQRLSLLELYCLMKRAALVIGVDSGVLHFTRFTDTPAIGLWTKHYPTHFALPRSQTVHLVEPGNPLTKLRRASYNAIEADPVDTAIKVLQPSRYLDQRGADTMLQTLLPKTNKDRGKSFDRFLVELRKRSNPTILETGCIREEDDWGAGFSTFLFGLFLLHHGGRLISVDLTEANCNLARRVTLGLPVDVVHSHSWDYLKSYQGKLDALYLDSLDTYEAGHSENCLEELRLALPHLAEDALILIDDSPYTRGGFTGKGAVAVPWALANGFRLLYAGYQVLLRKDK